MVLNPIIEEKHKIWLNKNYKKAFETFKEKVINYPNLQYPYFENEFIIASEAINSVLGAVFSQGEIDEDLPIADASRTKQNKKKNFQ